MIGTLKYSDVLYTKVTFKFDIRVQNFMFVFHIWGKSDEIILNNFPTCSFIAAFNVVETEDASIQCLFVTEVLLLF